MDEGARAVEGRLEVLRRPEARPRPVLHTICEEARCPNISECWGRGTATFQILGDTCTRACRYCYVHSGKPEAPPDPLEPLRLAQTAAQMRLKHVVVTSVDRDDLPDRGAGHYAATIRALKAKLPEASVEVLTPDFLGVEEEALQTVLAARPEVFNHNIETVRRLHPECAARRRATTTRCGCCAGRRRSRTIRSRRSPASSSASARRTTRSSRRCATCVRTVSTSSRSASTCSRPRSTRRSTAGSSGRVPLVPRAGRGARFRLGVRGAARALELPRRRAKARCGHGPRRGRVLNEDERRAASGGPPSYCVTVGPRADQDGLALVLARIAPPDVTSSR